MNKIIKITLFFLTATFLLWFFFFRSSEDVIAPHLEEITEESLIDFSLEERNIYEENEELMYRVNISYPYFTNDDFNQVNREIELIIDIILSEFKELAVLPIANDFGLDSSELNVDYVLARNDGKIFSVELIIHSAYLGAPRPIIDYISFNYDMERMRKIEITDCFDDFIFLSEYVKGQLSNKLGDSFFESGVEPLSRNYSKFVIKDNRLEIIFGYHQVAPRAMGPIRANIYFSDLREQMICNLE